MTIVPAVEADLPAIQQIIDRCGLGAEGLDYTRWTGILLVARRQGEVVGFIACLPGHPYSVITELGVLPEHQKGRACTKLIESLELLLRSLGMRAWAGYVGEKRELSEMLTKWGATQTGQGSMWVRRL